MFKKNANYSQALSSNNAIAKSKSIKKTIQTSNLRTTLNISYLPKQTTIQLSMNLTNPNVASNRDTFPLRISDRLR